MHYSVDREFVIARASNEYLLRYPIWPTEWKFHSVFMTLADYLYTGDSRSLEQCYEQLKGEKTLQKFARGDVIDNEAAKLFRLQLELPANMTAEINLPMPHAGGANITVRQDGHVVAYEQRDGGLTITSVVSGRHTFEIR